MKSIAITIILLFYFLKGFATNYYFSTLIGNDTRTQAQAANPATPWRTLAKATSVFSTFMPGDSLLFNRNETFYGFLQVGRSGTLSARIVISCYGIGARPIFLGLSPLINWVSIGGNKWESGALSTLPSYLNTVVQDNRLVAVGRYPNLSAPNLGYLTIGSAVGANQITINSLLNTPNFTGAYGVVRVNNSSIQFKLISSHVGTQVNFADPFYTNLKAGLGAFFIASPLTLDSTSEWYNNPTTKKISWYSTTIPTGVEAATITSTLSSTNFSNITIDNIHFRGSNGSNVIFTGGSNIIIQNCDVDFSGVSGIELNNVNTFTIQNNSVTSTQNEGIRVTGTTGGSILSNTIYKSGEIIGMAQDQGGTGRMNGIAVQGSNLLIQYNSCIRPGYGGIRWAGNNINIRENFIDSFNYVKSDGGGLYTPTKTATGNVVKRNIVLHGLGAPQGALSAPTAGIYLDANASNMIIDSNYLAYSEIDIFLHGGDNNTVTNNTTFANKYGIHVWQYDPTSLVRNDVIKNNIFGVNTITALPSFFRSTANDIGSFGSVDSNRYVAPLSTTSFVIRNQATNIKLPMWQTAYPQYDVHSAITPVTATNTSQVIFLYNKTSAVITPSLGASSYKDAFGNSYSGSITLQPYTAALLINTGTLIVPTITWATPSPITYGTTLSGLLNASTGIAGTFVYTRNGVVITNLTVLSGGTHTLNVLFIPTDQITYSTATKSVSLTVNKATATLAFGADTVQTFTGLPLAPTVITSPAGLTGVTILYDNVGQTPTNAKTSYQIKAGLNNQNFSATTITGTFRIAKKLASITITTTLNQVADGTAKVISSITSPLGLTVITKYNGSLTAPSAVGSYQVIKTINENNYQGADTSTLIISANTDAINITNIQRTYTGFSLPVTVTTIPSSQPYTITYNGSPTVAVNAGTYTVIATRNDLSGADTATLIVSKADPVITWAIPNPIPIGTELTSLQLSASANVAGSFSYTPTFGNVPSAGTQILNTTFTPTDTNNYNSISKSIVISVHGNSNSSETYYIRNGHIIYINTP